MASEPFADSDPTSRTTDARLGEDAVRLAGRFGNFPSSDTFDLGDLGLAVRDGVSFSSLDVLDFKGVSGRAVLLDLEPSSFLDRRLEDDLVDPAFILILAFPSLDFSSAFSSRSPTGVPFLDER